MDRYTRDDEGSGEGSSVASSSQSCRADTRHTVTPFSSRSSIQEKDGDEKDGLMEEEWEEKGSSSEGASLQGGYQKRSFINPDVVRDIIIGLSDGLTVPFALTAGLSSLDNSKIVVLGGLAELVSGAISMGVGGMLSAQAELDHYQYTVQQTSQRIRRSRRDVLEGEVRSIFEPLGLSAATSAQVAAELHEKEEEEWQEHEFRRGDLPSPCPSTKNTTSSFTPQRGLTPLIIRMGEGLEGIEARRVWQSALFIGSSYVLGGLIPLLPYLFLSSVTSALFASAGITAVALLVFGIVKQKCTGRGDWKSLTKSALSTMAVGGIAAGSSWAIVRLLER
ncbi:hypothetical protein CBS101457_002918 [Exobasidium rhododendri]|nr:hypothetical protein CBS101457_002918 [Exobasidium rhododendri]